jgi:hypothetical protein
LAGFSEGQPQQQGTAANLPAYQCIDICCRHATLPCNPACAGEINTLQGNLNWVASRQAGLRNDIWQGREGEFLPLCSARGEWAGCSGWGAAAGLGCC